MTGNASQSERAGSAAQKGTEVAASPNEAADVVNGEQAFVQGPTEASQDLAATALDGVSASPEAVIEPVAEGDDSPEAISAEETLLLTKGKWPHILRSAPVRLTNGLELVEYLRLPCPQDVFDFVQATCGRSSRIV